MDPYSLMTVVGEEEQSVGDHSAEDSLAMLEEEEVKVNGSAARIKIHLHMYFYCIPILLVCYSVLVYQVVGTYTHPLNYLVI